MKQYKIDVAMLGDKAVGKTSILQQWSKGQFSEEYTPTVSDVFEKRITRRRSVRDSSKVDLRIFDTCGSMAFPALNRVTISRSDAFVIAYSVDCEKSFECAQRLLKEVAEVKNLERIPLVIVGNKSDGDMESREVTFEQGLKFAVEAKASFMEVSAKTGQNIDDLFFTLSKRFDAVELMKDSQFPSPRLLRRTRRFLGIKIGCKSNHTQLIFPEKAQKMSAAR